MRNKENHEEWEAAELDVEKAGQLYENGQFPFALAELESAIKRLPEAKSSWYFNEGLILDSIGDFRKAIRKFWTALKLKPADLGIMACLAVDYTRIGKYDKAIDYCEKIQLLDLDFEPCYCIRIITYGEMGNYDLSEEMFYLSQQIRPDCFLCYHNIGISLFVQGQYQKAIKCWQKAVELEPNISQINHLNYLIVKAYWVEGCYNRSRDYFLREIQGSPADIKTIFDFGLFSLYFGKIESAKITFQWMLEIWPNDASILFSQVFPNQQLENLLLEREKQEISTGLISLRQQVNCFSRWILNATENPYFFWKPDWRSE